MKKWWDAHENARQKVIFQAIPNIVLWFIWKRRSTVLHKVLHDINSTLQKFIKLKFE